MDTKQGRPFGYHYTPRQLDAAVGWFIQSIRDARRFAAMTVAEVEENIPVAMHAFFGAENAYALIREDAIDRARRGFSIAEVRDYAEGMHAENMDM